NDGGWTCFALTWSATNSALYVNGLLVTNGAGVSAYPGPDVLANGWFIGSDDTGTAQAHGAFSGFFTYDHPLSADAVATDYLLYGLLRDPGVWVSVPGASSSPSYTPAYNAITGSGNV